jgi:hypothetical protein
MQRSTAINIPIPLGIKPAGREAIAKAAIEYMIERSKADNDIRGKSFAEYSEEYEKRKGQSKVDLTLSDTMLNEMEIIRSEKGKIRIGYKSGSAERGKAEGNHYGTYGRPKPISGKARPFIGFVGKERQQLISIIATYGDVTKKSVKERLKGSGSITP